MRMVRVGLLASGLATAAALVTAPAADSAAKSNIVLVLTDDQDDLLGSMTNLPQLQQLLGPTGARFTMFVSTPICCPSRSAFLTGSYCHNTRTYQNQMNCGCSNHTTWQLGLEKTQSIGPLLQQGGRGYTTGYFGKYLNSYGYPDAGNATVNGTGWVPPGWNRWFGLLGNSQYYGYTVSSNGVAVHYARDYASDYFTDVLKNQSAAFLEAALEKKSGGGGPAFAMVATPACHDPFDPAPQYSRGQTANVSNIAPRTPNWNTGMAGKHFLVSARPTMTPAAADFSDLIHRRRAATLRSVDDLVAKLHGVVSAAGQLDQTWWFYSSDNGFHLGQFAFVSDKRLPYEADVRVPLLIAGPTAGAFEKKFGLPAGIWSPASKVALNIDIAPTLLALAGLPANVNMDGQSLLVVQRQSAGQRRWRQQREEAEEGGSFLVEYWGSGSLRDRPTTGVCPARTNCSGWPRENAQVGLGRLVALYYRASILHHIHGYIRCCYF